MQFYINLLLYRTDYQQMYALMRRATPTSSILCEDDICDAVRETKTQFIEGSKHFFLITISI